MRLSMKGDYGVRAVLDLAERYGQGPIQSEAIAGRQGIPDAYLDQLLTQLRRAGLVHSVRGPRGGHHLARSPSQIAVGDVLAALEGNVLPTGPDGPSLPSVRVQQEVWQRIRDASERVLYGTTIEDLLERQRALEEQARYVI